MFQHGSSISRAGTVHAAAGITGWRRDDLVCGGCYVRRLRTAYRWTLALALALALGGAGAALLTHVLLMMLPLQLGSTGLYVRVVSQEEVV